MNVPAWRAFTSREMISHLERIRSVNSNESEGPIFRSLLVVRKTLSPVDVYCYLKARFGEPNGLQNRLRRDTSDNLFHWDFNLKADCEDVYISGTNREVHLHLSEGLANEDWPKLIRAIKSDYARVGEAKSAIMRSLEKWVIFPNRFVAAATVAADLHRAICKSTKTISPTGIGPLISEEFALNCDR